MTLSKIRGQDRAIGLLRAQYAGCRVPHAYIFAGQRGVGKRTTARAFARLLNCERAGADAVDPCGECIACRLIARRGHPAVMEIDFDWQTQVLNEKRPRKRFYYSIDTVHELIGRLSLTAPASHQRVVIIDRAELCTTDASNALLKILEEPPPQTVFILTVEQLQRMLPTILSRAQLVRFKPLDESSFRAIAAGLRSAVVVRDFYAAGGAPGRLLEEEQDAPLFDPALVREFIDGSCDASALVERLQAVRQSRETVAEFIRAALHELRGIVSFAAGQGEVLQALLDARRQLERFVNAQLVFLALILRVDALRARGGETVCR